MDVSKYHARYPPPEHEEAVRMLLEGLDKQQTGRSDLNSKTTKLQASTANPRTISNQSKRGEQVINSTQRREEPSNIMTKSKIINKSSRDNYRASPSAASSVDSGSMARGPSEEEEEEDDRAYEFRDSQQLRKGATSGEDDLQFNSEESSSREFSIQVSPQISSKRNHVAPILPKMQSKSTSTASDTISSSGASSSGQHNRATNELADADDDTMNGNYEAIPSRTIAIQCDLKLSSIKRDGYLDSASTDLASMAASSISSTRYGFYRLSPETLEQRRQLARSVSSRNIAQLPPSPPAQPANFAEAPTSMSELSSDEDEVEVGGFDRELAEVATRRKTSLGQRSAVDDEDDFGPTPSSIRLRRNDRFLSQRQLHQPADQRGASRMRHQDSLPRRPKTALSYVSTSRLRDNNDDDQRPGSATGEQTPDKSLSDHEPEMADPVQRRVPMSHRMTPRNRAMSQQVLSSSRPHQRVSAVRTTRPDEQKQSPHNHDNVSLSNSDGELQNAEQRFNRRLPQEEEEIFVATKRGRPAMGASPQVRRSNNIRNGPLLRRYATLTTPTNTTINKENNSSVHERSDLSDREMLAIGGQHRRLKNNMASNKLSSSGTNYSTTTDEENQLVAAAETRRQRAATLADQQQPKSARFSSMSLSRRQPLINNQLDQTRGSCNLTTRARPLATAKANTVTAHPTDEPVFEPATAHPNQETNYHHNHQRSTLARADRLANYQSAAPAPMTSDRAQIGRSASMKQGRTRLLATGEYEPAHAPVYTSPNSQTSHRQRNYYDPGTQCEYDDCCGPPNAGNLDDESPGIRTWANPSSTRRQANQSHHQSVYNLSNDNPAANYDNRRPSYPQNVQSQANGRLLTRKSARSHSMRDVNLIEGTNNSQLIPGIHNRPRRFERIYRAGQEQLDQEDDADLVGRQQQQQPPQPHDEVPSEEVSVCSSSSINGATREVLTRAQAHHQPLDFDSQQRLNEIGLPEPSHSVAASPSTKRASASHLGLSAGLSSVANRYATTGRNSQQAGPTTLITGRAMSQQSLTRPTMPLSRRLRRSGGGGGASVGSGSDVGGSSISLVSRLRDGSRYENAHTRTPVVMLIPQATPSSKQGGAEGLMRSESNSRRASSRLGRPLGKTSGLRVSSQDRASYRRSASRNNSDSESSSSMLRTLVKPRGVSRMGSTNRSARRGRPAYAGGHTRDDSDLEENMDGVGQLATEIDSYKFRRRYSVPKDAKINWFSKLKQRVTSKN